MVFSESNQSGLYFYLTPKPNSSNLSSPSALTKLGFYLFLNSKTFCSFSSIYFDLFFEGASCILFYFYYISK